MKICFIWGEIIIDFLAILVSIVGGTILFLALQKKFDINHFGFRAMGGIWTVCFIAAFIIFTVIVDIILRVLGF